MKRPDGVYYRLLEVDGKFKVVEMQEFDETDYNQSRLVQGLFCKSESKANILAMTINASMGDPLRAHMILALAELLSREEAL